MQLFPSMERKHVKNKYTRELRDHPDKVGWAGGCWWLQMSAYGAASTTGAAAK